jgi:2'-5' RNA ligase
MKRRLFIAVNLDPRTRAAIGKIEKDIEDGFGRDWDGRIRFMPDENWHITVSFLGTQDDADLTAIMRAMRAAAEEFSPVDISFAEIAYAPQKDTPRMIWLRTAAATSRTLGDLQSSLERHLDAAGVRFERESRAFSGHITLARFLASAPRGDLPAIERKIKVGCTGASLDLMESELDRSGAKYTVLQEFPFKEA